MTNVLRDIWDALTAGWRHHCQRRRLRNRAASIVANNCWAGFMYRYLGMPFNSPFVGLFIMAPDYVRLLENVNMLKLPLRFITRQQSRYASLHAHLDPYPIGLLGDDIEIHFLHYKDAAEAAAKWQRRVQRLDWDNALVAMSQCDGADYELMQRFDRLPFRHKVLFTAQPLQGLKSAVYLPEYASKQRVGAAWRVCHRHYDVVQALNSINDR